MTVGLMLAALGITATITAVIAWRTAALYRQIPWLREVSGFAALMAKTSTSCAVLGWFALVLFIVEG